MRTLLAVGAIALLAACGSNRTNSNLLNEEDAADAQNWFCQPGAVGEEWDCDRYMASDPVPKPTRSVGGAAAAGVTSNTPSFVDEINENPLSLDPTADAARSLEPEPQRQPPPPETGSLAVDQPGYVALSYRPDEPVAILDLPRDFYAIQLVALSSQEALEKYAVDRDIRGMSAARIAANRELYYVLILGIYETKEHATEALPSVPKIYSNPWVRSVGSLQDAMLKADALAAEPLGV